MVVVLPAPLWPSSAVMRPDDICMLSPSTATRVLPSVLVNVRRSPTISTYGELLLLLLAESGCPCSALAVLVPGSSGAAGSAACLLPELHMLRLLLLCLLLRLVLPERQYDGSRKNQGGST
jgi:hypothetical protein